MKRIYQYLYEVQCFEEKLRIPETEKDFRMLDMSTVRVYAGSEEEAIEKAKTRIKKQFYRISTITEYEDHTAMQEEQLRIQQQMADALNETNNPKKPWEK